MTKKFNTEYEEANYYRDNFERLIIAGEKIYTKDWKQFVELTGGEEFRQCWADTPTRRLFPKRWFASSDHLLSVYKNRIMYIPKNYRKKGRAYYKYTYVDENNKRNNKNIEVHNLIWLTWEVPSFGKAEDVLKERGVHGFGVSRRDVIVVQGHHKDGDKNNNDPCNGKFTTAAVHDLLENAPAYNADPEKTEKYMRKVAEVLSEETERPCVIYTGECGKSVDELRFTGEKDIDYIDINEPIKVYFKVDVILEAAQCFIEKCGVEKFNEKDRYVYIDNEKLNMKERFYDVYFDDGQIKYNRITNFIGIGKKSPIFVKIG